MKKTIRKINHLGQYCPYRGTTVICSIGAKQLEVWRRLYSAVQNCASAYYAPLPHESYHLTVASLYNQFDSSDSDWAQFITKTLPVFQRINAILKDKAFNPEFTIEGISLGNVIQLRVKLPAAQEALFQQLTTDLGIDSEPQEYHITLAYQYREIHPEVRVALRQELQSVLSGLFESHGNQFQLNPAQLCYFNDMTAFIPWQGTSNAFSPPPSNNMSFARWFSVGRAAAAKHSDGAEPTPSPATR